MKFDKREELLQEMYNVTKEITSNMKQLDSEIVDLIDEHLFELTDNK